MKSLNIKYLLLAFVLTFAPLALLDYFLQNFFLSDGRIANAVVGNILNFQLTTFELFWSGLFVVLLIIGLAATDRIVYKGKPYKFKENVPALSAYLGVLVTSVLLIAPLLHPSDYQKLLGLILIVVGTLFLRRQLLRRK